MLPALSAVASTKFGIHRVGLAALLAMCFAGCVGSSPTKPSLDRGDAGLDGSTDADGSSAAEVTPETAGPDESSTGGAGGTTTVASGGADGTPTGGAGGTPTGGAGGSDIDGGGVGHDTAAVEGGADSATGTGSASDGGADAVDAGGTCITALSGTYTIRSTGHAVSETASSETVVVDYASGTAATPLQNVRAVQQQYYAACALLAGGTVSCWQQDATNGNVVGQLGNGTQTPIARYRAVPVLVKADQPLTHVVGLAAGVYTNASCAVTDDKKLWCWGDLTWVVNGGTKDISPYAQVITKDGQNVLTGVLQAAVGMKQACAVIEGSPDNSVWCWGAAAAQELGQGNYVAHQYPVQVPGLSKPTKVVLATAWDGYMGGGPRDAVCVLDQGTVECWGSSGNGGVGAPAPTLVVTAPNQVLRDVIDIQEGGFVGAYNTLGQLAFLRNGGTAWISPAAIGPAAAYGVPEIMSIGWGGGGSVVGPAVGFRYITSDGQYHVDRTNPKVDCSL